MWPLYLVWYCIVMIHEEIQSTQNIYHISIAKQKKVRVDRITAFIVDDDEEEETQIQTIISLLSTMKTKFQILAPI